MKPTESWAPLSAEYPELADYMVSDRGKLKRKDKVYSTSNAPGGYVVYRVMINGKRKKYPAAELVLTAFRCARPDGMVIRHINDIRDDNRLENLEWGTLSENSYDAVRNGRNWEANKTACVRGHLLEPPNLVESLIGKRRMCKACHMVEVNRATDPPGGRKVFRHSKTGFLRRAGESKADESDRRYLHIMGL